MRGYGEGFVVVEQIPSKLAPDVIKNTNLRIVHRLVSGDDVGIISGAMSLTERQRRRITSLKVGESVVYGENDDHPIIVQVQYSKLNDTASSRTVEESAISALMQKQRQKTHKDGV
jgi:DNA helicase HerA-like ATPase